MPEEIVSGDLPGFIFVRCPDIPEKAFLCRVASQCHNLVGFDPTRLIEISRCAAPGSMAADHLPQLFCISDQFTAFGIVEYNFFSKTNPLTNLFDVPIKVLDTEPRRYFTVVLRVNLTHVFV